jgi:hypothetical protein
VLAIFASFANPLSPRIDMDAMMDVIFIVLMFAFFGASAWLVHFCSRLMGDKGSQS